MAEREYFKLTPVRQRRGVALFTFTTSRSNLWLGKDHLLSVEVESYTESYKRFYFRDIQAITLRKTPRRLIIGIILGFLWVMFAVLAAAINDPVGRWFFGTVAVIFLLPFLVNLLLGPTCTCQLKTAVQTEDIPSMSRVRRAHKVLARLAPLIAAAQGQLTQEQVAAQMQSPANYGTTAPATSAAPESPESPAAPAPDVG